MDSSSEVALSYFRALGTEIVSEGDQDSTDLDKSLNAVIRLSSRDSDPALKKKEHVVVLGDFDGRLDHILGILHAAARVTREWPEHRQLYVVGRSSIAFFLRPGITEIETNPALETGGGCGLIPLGTECTDCTTTGLKWNLGAENCNKTTPLRFGDFISTSNRTVGGVVSVETGVPLLWTSELRKDISLGGTH
eukprot:TRINITY_DN1974_c0_g1_i10.p1 TRINITY_DN1974_c0_g1~~TRINITY_DN1974_c0_g1_i10.p1  ORF type:complete len:193 (-),score=27.34 TRINITY_DN1974_c0_g1_i10:50-628(-)